MYIMREYREEMAGMIPDEMVMRAANGRWFTNEEIQDFKSKSTPRCPTHGVCEHSPLAFYLKLVPTILSFLVNWLLLLNFPHPRLNVEFKTT
jgi:hypothetical protein